MVNYNIAIPQQQLFQAPDFTQNAMRMQQTQLQEMQMQALARENAEARNIQQLYADPNFDQFSPEGIRRLAQTGGYKAGIAAATGARQNEQLLRLTAATNAGLEKTYQELGVAKYTEAQNSLASIPPGDAAGYTAWLKVHGPAYRANGVNLATPEQWAQDPEGRLQGHMVSTSQSVRERAAAREKAGQFTVEMTDAGPVAKNNLGQYRMATALDAAPVAGGALVTGGAPVAGAGAPAVGGAPMGGGVGAPAMPGAAAPTGRAGAAAAPAGFDMDRAKYASGSIESGGRYNAVGPVTNRGDRAYGKYQVMGANIPSWTKEALGSSMTPSEFLASPEAQEKVFETQFGKSVAKYGNPADAASVWFSGRPLAKAGNASDVLGTTVPQYVQKFMAAYEGGTNTPAMMRSPGFASSSGIPANVGLPVAPVLNAFAGQQPAQQGNALAMQPVPVTTAPAQVGPAPSALSPYQQGMADAAKRKLQQEGEKKRQDLEIAQQERIQASLPQIEDAAEQTLKNIEGLIGGAQVDAKGRIVYAKGAKRAHPGFGDAVGLTFSKMLTSTPIAGTSRADFEKRLDQVKGSTFLDAYNMLRGGGAIDQKEGQKATAALNRMDLAQSEVEFVRAARDFEEIVRKGVARARTMAQGGAGSNMTSAATAAATAPGAEGAKRGISKTEYDALPSGSVYTAPNGEQRTKR
jgi:hypothetical protein